MAWFWDHYVPDAEQRRPPRRRAAPRRGPRRPAAGVVLTAEHDVLRDEGEAYADALARGGRRASTHRRCGGPDARLLHAGQLLPGAAPRPWTSWRSRSPPTRRPSWRRRASDEHGARAATPSSSAPGSPASTLLHRLRELGPVRARLRGRATASAAPGTGTATPAPAATSRASTTPTRSRRSSSRSGSGASATPTQPEILRYLNHVADRFDLRRDIQLDTARGRRRLRRDHRPLGGRHRTADGAERWSAPGTASWPPAASRAGHVPDFPGLDDFAGRVATTPAPGRTRASTSPASASA